MTRTQPQKTSDALRLCRTVRFGETDAAGVMHFHHLLRWCHEAYEESLERFGLSNGEIFPSPHASPAVALPIVHCEADYLAPLVAGDGLTIQLEPKRLDPGCFEVHYAFRRTNSEDQQTVARALTRHLAIEARSRQRCNLPDPINRWLEAASLNQGIQPL